MFSPKEIAQNYVATGASKTKLSIAKMLLLGVLAGMFIALAGAGTTAASSTIENAAAAKTISALLFPAGLAMTLVSGSELFTGNCLIIISVLEKQARISSMLKNWVFVYIGNFIGGILVSALVVYSHSLSMFANDFAVTAINTAIAKTNLKFGDALLRGILCNFLVCIAVWMSMSAKDTLGKIAGLFFPIMLFIASGFEHCVANMYYITAGLFATTSPVYSSLITQHPNLTLGAMFVNNLIPVTIGNIIGGMVLVGISYWFIYLRGAGKNPSAG